MNEKCDLAPPLIKKKKKNFKRYILNAPIQNLLRRIHLDTLTQILEEFKMNMENYA